MYRRHHDYRTPTAALPSKYTMLLGRRWPEPIPLRDKLYGNLGKLSRTGISV